MCNGKEVENRSWWPLVQTLGKWFALHAATRPQPIEVEKAMMAELGRLRVGALPRRHMPMRSELDRGAFVAVGQLMGAVEQRDTVLDCISISPTTYLYGNSIVMTHESTLVPKLLEIARSSRYAERGRVNWVFRPIVVLDEPVPYRRGLQRIWRVPRDETVLIMRQLVSKLPSDTSLVEVAGVLTAREISNLFTIVG
jgi:hypothetical protein